MYAQDFLEKYDTNDAIGSCEQQLKDGEATGPMTAWVRSVSECPGAWSGPEPSLWHLECGFRS